MYERIKTLRKELGLTQQEFADRIGVTKVAISNLENGHHNITRQMTVAIYREFGVNRQWLLTGEGEMFRALPPVVPTPATCEVELSPKDAIYLAELVNNAPADRLPLIRAILEKAGIFTPSPSSNK